MPDINSLDLLNSIKKKDADPNFPTAPFKRIIKIHAKDKYVAGDAALQLKTIIYEFAEEITRVADKLCDFSKKKTINAEMIQQAYEFLRENKK